MENRIDPKKQFSKKLARWTSIFWFIFMSWLSAILIIEPGAAIYSVYMAIISTAVMIINVAAYTRNSIYEKMALAVLDKSRIELNLGKASAQEAEEDDDLPEEGVSNG